MMKEKEVKSLDQLLEDRWSRRSFSEQKIEGEKIYAIFNAGRQIASSFNEQPWHIILASKEDDSYPALFDALEEFNQKWCKMAPYIGVAVAKTYFDKNKKDNRHCFHDTGAFLAVSSLKAIELGIYIHEMAGFDSEKIKSSFDLPEKYEPITMFAMGKPGKKEKLPDDLLKKESPESDRKEVNDFLFGNDWEEPFEFKQLDDYPPIA